MGGDSFKSGSGNLDFGGSGEEEEEEPPVEDDEPVDDVANDEAEEEDAGVPSSTDADERRGDSKTEGVSSTQQESTTSTAATSASRTEQAGGQQYPYFVRRSNVGDERDNRLELFARDEVVSREGEFRSRLASELGADDVSKTDAREYALLAAFDNVEEVADLMREDGYGELD